MIEESKFGRERNSSDHSTMIRHFRERDNQRPRFVMVADEEGAKTGKELQKRQQMGEEEREALVRVSWWHKCAFCGERLGQFGGEK